MKNISFFTVDDVREVNQSRINKQTVDLTKLTPVSQKIIRETRFTAKDINKAFAAARKSLESI
jgi:hypothetical protein